jgi:hypothetical protein
MLMLLPSAGFPTPVSATCNTNVFGSFILALGRFCFHMQCGTFFFLGFAVQPATQQWFMDFLNVTAASVPPEAPRQIRAELRCYPQFCAQPLSAKWLPYDVRCGFE